MWFISLIFWVCDVFVACEEVTVTELEGAIVGVLAAKDRDSELDIAA